MSPFWRGFLITLAVLVIVGCLGGSIGLIVGLRTGALALPNGIRIPVLSGTTPDGYLSQQSDVVIFITFDSGPQQGDNTGTVYEAYVQNGNYAHESGPWTGTQNGANLTMHFGSGTTWRAVWQGTNLQVTYLDINGLLDTETFTPASTSDYNNAASALQQSTQ